MRRDGKAMAGTVIDLNKTQQAARWQGGRSWRTLGPLVPNAVPCQQSLSVATGTSGDGRVIVGGGWYGTDPAESVRPLCGLPMGGVHRVRAAADPGWTTTHGRRPCRRTAAWWSASTPP